MGTLNEEATNPVEETPAVKTAEELDKEALEAQKKIDSVKASRRLSIDMYETPIDKNASVTIEEGVVTIDETNDHVSNEFEPHVWGETQREVLSSIPELSDQMVYGFDPTSEALYGATGTLNVNSASYNPADPF